MINHWFEQWQDTARSRCCRMLANPVDEEFAARGLRRHPIEAGRYFSIGRMTRIDRVRPGEDACPGHRRGRANTE
jgi:hypothetical protein